jgi:hypothetical protein
MDDAPNWTISLEIIGIVVAMACLPLLPLAAWKFDQWRIAERERRERAGQK